METIKERQHMFAIMDETGDTKHIWNPDNEFETENARKMFTDFRKKRYMIYKANADGSKGTVMHEFDPNAEKMIMVPAVVGG